MGFKMKFCFRSASRHQTMNDLQVADSAAIDFSCKLLVPSYPCDRGPVGS